MTTQDRNRAEPLENESADLGIDLDERNESVVAEDAEDSPRETPLMVADYGTTGAEEKRDEPLTQRLHRERPDVSAGHRPIDPDRVAARAFAGRIVEEAGGAHVAEGDTGGFAPEEIAMHLMPEPRAASGRSVGRTSTADRLDALEAEVVVLMRTAQILVDALHALAVAEEGLPTDEPGDRGAKARRAARTAHDLLLMLREQP